MVFGGHRLASRGTGRVGYFPAAIADHALSAIGAMVFCPLFGALSPVVVGAPNLGTHRRYLAGWSWYSEAGTQSGTADHMGGYVGLYADGAHLVGYGHTQLHWRRCQ